MREGIIYYIIKTTNNQWSRFILDKRREFKGSDLIIGLLSTTEEQSKNSERKENVLLVQ
jgi:hypothetical protein